MPQQPTLPVPKRDTKNRGKARAETPPSLASALSSLICKRTLYLAHDNGQPGHRRQSCQQSPSLTAVGNQKSKGWCLAATAAAVAVPQLKVRDLRSALESLKLL